MELIQFNAPEKGEEIAVLQTSMGVIKIRLFPEQTPKAYENFTTHIKNGYYDGIAFHRVINGFMIQGGDPLGNGTGGESIWGRPFADEFQKGLFNFRGALSMANCGPNTNGSQFFIVHAEDASEEYIQYWQRAGLPAEAVEKYRETGGTVHLDGGYVPGYGHTVFGQVFEGIDVVDNIASVKVGANDKPRTPVVIEKAFVEAY